MKFSRRTLLAVAMLCAFAVPSMADYYTGQEAYENGDYKAAFREWMDVAKDGDPEAQFLIGKLYRAGEGVARDDARAAIWYERAAELGHAQAQNNLAVMYETGVGVAQDDAVAARWYRQAAQQGRAVAQFNLARLLEEGRGVERDEAEAATWYRRAAGHGHIEAQYRVGLFHEQGRGVPQDDAKAAKWYRRALNRGNEQARERLDAMRAQGRLVKGKQKKRKKPALTAAPSAPSDPAPPSIAPQPNPTRQPVRPPRTNEPPRVSEVRSGADDGDPQAQYELARRYATGRDLEPDPQRAEDLYLLAAKQGHAMAAYKLGFLYMRGLGGSGRRDYASAHAWLGLAADLEVGDAAVWRDKVEKKMTKSERARSAELRRELKTEVVGSENGRSE